MTMSRTNTDPGPTTELVRRFSDQQISSQPRNPLAQGLHRKVTYDRDREKETNDALREWEEIAFQRETPVDHRAALLKTLEEQYKKLLETWQKFQKSHEKATKIKVDGKVPDRNAILAAIDSQQKKLDKDSSTAMGKLRTGFRKVCQSVKSHDNVLKVLPKDDKYFCILLGSITTITEAGANHGKITEAIASTLETIDENLAYWKARIEKHGNVNVKMYEGYIRLYVLQCELLTEIFDQWSRGRWQRLAISFNQEALEELLNKKKQEMKDLQHNMKMEEDNIQHDTTREHIGEGIKETQRARQQMHALGDMTKALGQMMIEIKDDSARTRDKMSLSVGAASQILLQNLELKERLIGLERRLDASVLSIDGHMTPQRMLEGSPLSLRSSSPESARSVVDPPVIDKALHNAITKLGDSTVAHLSALADMIGRIQLLAVDQGVQRQLTAFLDAPSSQTIWIEGPPGAAIPSQNTTTAAILANVVQRDEDVVCVQYFNSIASTRHGKYRHVDALGDMITSMIVQLLGALNEEEMAAASLSAKQVSDLETRKMNFNDALNMLTSLRNAIATRPVFFIIDYCQALDYPSDRNYTELLLRLFEVLWSFHSDQQSDDSMQSPAVNYTKICLTTDGYMASLSGARRKGLVQWIGYDTDADELNCDATESWQ